MFILADEREILERDIPEKAVHERYFQERAVPETATHERDWGFGSLAEYFGYGGAG